MASQPVSPANHTIYFGYGSNLWLHQMRSRCPTSVYLGVARLGRYKWIINNRGYANVVELPADSRTEDARSPDSEVVFGLVYSLAPSDERRLDDNEGVPVVYAKEHLECDFWKAGEQTGWVDVRKAPTGRVRMLVYVDRKRTVEDRPQKEYVYRMNQGITDAINMGVPKAYVDEVMRRFIPKDGGEGAKALAERQAVKFEDESDVIRVD